MPESTVHTFDDITARLDEIIATVRSKDTSLERSLDLFDEAISLGSKAVDLVDSFDLSPREAQALEEGADPAAEPAGDQANAGQDGVEDSTEEPAPQDEASESKG